MSFWSRVGKALTIKEKDNIAILKLKTFFIIREWKVRRHLQQTTDEELKFKM